MIREYLQNHPEVIIQDECKDAQEALSAIEKNDPDLLFLDIQLPEINGFELLQMLDKIPHVIFSTAYNQYAIKAFEINAVDYLLKPYTQERFDKALERDRSGLVRHQADDLDRPRQGETERAQVGDQAATANPRLRRDA
ncbi:MAG: response regulator, partial [bacterium]